MASKRKLNFRMDSNDRERLEIISEAYGVSLAGALRIALKAMLRQLGLEREQSSK